MKKTAALLGLSLFLAVFFSTQVWARVDVMGRLDIDQTVYRQGAEITLTFKVENQTDDLWFVPGLSDPYFYEIQSIEPFAGQVGEGVLSNSLAPYVLTKGTSALAIGVHQLVDENGDNLPAGLYRVYIFSKQVVNSATNEGEFVGGETVFRIR